MHYLCVHQTTLHIHTPKQNFVLDLPDCAVYNVGYDRWSISFIIFKGSELGIFEHGEDELLISKDFPEAAGKHCGVVPKALVAHYS